MQRLLRHTFFKSLFTWLLVFVSLPAWCDNHILARAYWQDQTANATFEQAKTQPLIAFDGVLSRGYTTSAIWIRLTIAPVTDQETLVLRIRPVFLDDIRLYDPMDTSGKSRKTGDTTNYNANEYKSLSHTFVIATSHQPRDVWLRLTTTSTSLISIEAFTKDEMLASEFDLLMINFVVLSVVAVFMLLVLINWYQHREFLYAVFVIRQVYFFFYTASLFGLHRYFLSELLSSGQLDLLFSCMVIGSTLLTFAFEFLFLNEYAPPKWVKAILVGFLLWSLCVVLMFVAGYVSPALKFNMLLNTVGVVALLVISAAFIKDKKLDSNPKASLLSKKIVVGYYLSINVVLVFSLMPYLGLMKGNEFAVNGLVFYSLCSGLIMTVLMQLRANQIRKRQDAIEQELLISKKQIELEKNRREEQTHLFHMLMHELKNPLAIIDMALIANNDLPKTRGYVSRAVKNMKSILERCVKADKLTEGSVTIYKEHIKVNEFLKDLLISEGHAATKVILDGVDEFTVYTDEQFFSIMCSNLIDNAVRYGDPAVPAVIRTQVKLTNTDQSGVCITFSNRPSAASWPDPARVFTKYYRSAGAESQSGTGLGLYLVRTLARLVGGDCVYVPDNTNIRFELWLPS